MPNAKELFDQGKLKAAIEALNAEIRANPTDTKRRAFLGELLCFAGDIDRADRTFDIIGQQNMEAAVPVAGIRHVLRGEMHRRESWNEGRLPEFLDQPPEWLKQTLQSTVLRRGGDAAGAAKCLAEAEAARPAVKGTCNGAAFDDWRDADDTTAGFMEVLTATGKYYWVPFGRIQKLAFERPTNTLDLLWRRAKIEVADGPQGEVYIPALYAGSDKSDDEAMRLGRATDWIEEGEGVVRGVGQRCFLIGEDLKSIMEIETLAFVGAGA
ncbi:MAG: SciE type virulence protein [Alphaproteobacteria bacterium]|nr:SciE type virulence protein [Alphaproteobacteria bacterium]